MEDRGLSTRSFVELIAAIVTPVTVVTALLLYFGWVRTTALFASFGVDPGLLNFGPTDYVLRSAEVVFRPALALLLLMIIGTFLLTLLDRWIESPSGQKHGSLAVGVGMPVIGALLMLASSLGLLGWLPPITSAMLLGSGVLVSFFSRGLWHRHQAARKGSSARRFPKVAASAFTTAIVCVALFWATAAYAQRSGEDFAQYITNVQSARPSITVYSKSRLQMHGEEPTGFADAPGEQSYQYKYVGMRVLTYANGRWFLIPERWGPRGSTVVLMDDSSIRVELRPAA